MFFLSNSVDKVYSLIYDGCHLKKKKRVKIKA